MITLGRHHNASATHHAIVWVVHRGNRLGVHSSVVGVVHWLSIVAWMNSTWMDSVLGVKTLMVGWHQEVTCITAILLVCRIEVEIYIVALGSIWRNLLAAVIKIVI
jgi:hypothetical protein